MIALTSPYLWYTARATGVVALVLLTLTVVLGTLVTTRVGGNATPRLIPTMTTAITGLAATRQILPA